MAMGTKRAPLPLWIDSESVVKGPGHPFYRRLNSILDFHGFDRFVEERCREYYKPGDRPSLPPSVYFRLNLVGYFEGIGSERAIAWKLADSISLRDFVGLPITVSTPNHSTISRTRRLISLETHQEVFDWVLKILAKSKLLRAKILGVDGKTLEANAAMRRIVQRVDELSYIEFLKGLAATAGIVLGFGTPRSLQGRSLAALFWGPFSCFHGSETAFGRSLARSEPLHERFSGFRRSRWRRPQFDRSELGALRYATGC